MFRLGAVTIRHVIMHSINSRSYWEPCSCGSGSLILVEDGLSWAFVHWILLWSSWRCGSDVNCRGSGRPSNTCMYLMSAKYVFIVWDASLWSIDWQRNNIELALTQEKAVQRAEGGETLNCWVMCFLSGLCYKDRYGWWISIDCWVFSKKFR